ncbi:type II toxin-antitoxin system VapC family toxin [Sphaerisporangium aureirubrum]|uniref:Type II toxin-antitoxin system VapC family toxin n=1 Tax=Sphaerisporangium aureirubrum TaxID=1544736 RepID=A0ABW1NL51_9ACTN
MTRFVIDAPVAIRLATDGVAIPAGHALLAPALLRSQALALLYGSVRRGDTDERTAKKTLDGIRSLRIRLLGDRVLQSVAWEVAHTLGWPDTYQAEYVALTRLQADALVTLDAEFAKAASTLITTAPLTKVLQAP